jgi:acyl-CoA synthetase (AMP-forming)/AMP-acid ligase II
MAGPVSDGAAEVLAAVPVDTVHGLIERAAQLQPQALYALASEGGTTLSYAQLQHNCMRIGQWLRGLGLQPGDTVSLVMPNGLATLQWLLGAMHAGCCVNPVNLLSQPEQLRYVLQHSDCKLVLASADWLDKVHAAVPQLRVLQVDPEALGLPVAQAAKAAAASAPAEPTAAMPAEPNDLALPANPAAAADPIAQVLPALAAGAAAPGPQALALLMYTSGTTGNPKGVMLTQGNLAANAQSIAREHALGAQDRVLGVLPLYHINAFAVTMLAPLASGGSVVMAPRFSAQRFWPLAVEHGCTWVNVVPTMISYLLEGEMPERAALSRIRFCRSASAALPPEHLRAFESTFGIGVIETMGLTETVAPSFSNPLDAAQRKLGSVGRASGGEAQVVDAALQPVPDGTTGEITIRGPHVMQGYYKNPQATAEAFTPDGWLRTGDLGHRDAEGFYCVTGRIKELIIKGGENIAPREIDEALLKHPAVLDAAAAGVPDKHYGQEILACVVLRAGMQADEAELRQHCEQHLGRYKTPRHWRFVADLPRGPSGKVQRLKLTALYGG